jgi:hypothetical protein
MRFATALRLATGAAVSAAAGLLVVACSDGVSPDCSDAQCGTTTVLPPLDATIDGEQADAAEEPSEDAAEESPAPGSDAGTDATAPADAALDAHDAHDGADDVHVSDSGHDASG